MEVFKKVPVISLFLVAVVLLISSSQCVEFNRTLFPSDFIFGAGSAAYQSEGAANEDGRGPNIWEKFIEDYPQKIADGSNGDVAYDFYHNYKDDIKLFSEIGMDSFRLSLAWSRILPKGNLRGGVNELGIQFYNNVINELLAYNITPFVTLFHLDPPQALDDLYGGFLSPNIVDDFRDYADVCFKSFGDRVKMWVTMNEANGMAINGYNSGSGPPGRCSDWIGNCTAGDSATEPYIVGHNMILSHSAAANLYKEKYQEAQKGQVGITLVTNWYVPKYSTAEHRAAAIRAFDFQFGWFADPIFFGTYPAIMRSIVGSRLPNFTDAQSTELKGSLDFLAVNYYTGYYVEPTSPNTVNVSQSNDVMITTTAEKDGTVIGPQTEMSWLYIYPEGFRDYLLYVKERYNNPILYVTENGMADAKNDSKPISEALNDTTRISYHQQHLSALLEAMNEGANVKGYFVWNFADDFEWDSGYTVRFGLVYIDYLNNLTRYLKQSAYWFNEFLLKTNSIDRIHPTIHPSY